MQKFILLDQSTSARVEELQRECRQGLSLQPHVLELRQVVLLRYVLGLVHIYMISCKCCIRNIIVIRFVICVLFHMKTIQTPR